MHGLRTQTGTDEEITTVFRMPTRPLRPASAVTLVALSCLLVAGCASGSDAPAPSTSAAAGSSAPTAAGSSAPTASTSPSSAAPSAAASSAALDADALTIAIAITGDQVSPNGEKINAQVGQQVDLIVNSDTDDEIHAHTGGDGYELEVKAGEPTTGSFTLTSAGSFEVESHHLGKIIVILNAR